MRNASSLPLRLACLAGLLLAAPVVTSHPGAPAASETPTRALRVAHYDFDRDVDRGMADRVGHSKDALTPRGGETRFVTESDLPGTVAGAIALGVNPGDAQYLVAENSEDTRLGSSYTIEAWIYPTHLGMWNRLALQWSSAPSFAYHLALHNGLVSLYHGQADGKYVLAEGGHVRLEGWHHVAGVAQRNDRDPSQSKLLVYLDGKLVGTGTFDGTIKTLANEDLGIGDSARAPSAGSRYRGYLDELTLWDGALEAQEIATHYAQRSAVLRKSELARRKREAAKRATLYRRIEKSGVEEIVFAARAPGRDPSNHYYANFGYSCIDPDYWIHGSDGGQLCKLNLRTGELKVLLDDPEGAVRDPQVHYDAARILFSYRKKGSHHYNLYEIRPDGTDLRQVTHGAWDDVEPTYLPNDDIIFCSTRCKRYIGCWLAQSAVLHRLDSTTKAVRMISSGAFTENTPSVLPDGRVLYTRWEYVNRDPVSFHHLWTLDPAGTRQMAYFGNMHPGGVFIDAKPIPHTDEVVLINSPGHGANEHAGFVAVVTSRYGPDARPAMRNISRSGGFRDPFPLSREDFLVARGNQILLMNSRGETEVLTTGAQMLHEPSPIISRPREKMAPGQVDLAKVTGTLILTDVTRGRNTEGLQRGSIKKLLVMEDLPKPANFHGGGSQPIGHGVTSTLKRILGTVPVEADGSACFEAPALRSLYFVALDERDLSVKQMRSFVTLQPGETTGCVGCHEPRTQAPDGGKRSVLLALRRAPSRIEPIRDVPAVMDFPRDVQPILSRRCLPCHGPDQREGAVVLSGDRGPVFSLSYYALFLHWQVKDTGGEPRHGSGRQPGNDKPSSTYSSASALMKKIDGSHHDVALTPGERKMVRLWIDAGAQYPGTYAAYGSGQIGGCWGNNEPIRVMADSWPSTPPAAEAIERRCGSCHPKGQLPRHVTARIPLDSWGDMLSWTRPLSRYSRHRLFNLSRPETSLVLLAALSREAGGYAKGEAPLPNGKARPIPEVLGSAPKPIVHPIVFAQREDPDYQKILAHVQAAKEKLEEIRRFDMADFKPNEHYVREMVRYGVLPPSFDLARDSLNVYATDQAYWRSLWHQPRPESR